MAYWLGVVTPEVREEATQEYDGEGARLYSFPSTRRKTVREKMKIGDRIIDYMTKRKVFFAAWEITGVYVHDPERRFAGKDFPECVTVTPIKIVSPKDGIKNSGVLVRRLSVRMSAVRLDDDVGVAILNSLQSVGR